MGWVSGQKHLRWAALVGLSACTIDALRFDTGVLDDDDLDSAIVGVIRSLDHVPQADAELSVGGNTQQVDNAGMAKTLHIPPGLIPARGLLEGHTVSHVTVDVMAGWDSGAQLYLVPVTEYTTTVTDGATQISEAGVFTVDTPTGSLEFDDQPANRDLTTQIAVLDRERTLAMPGSLNALRLDAIVEPISLFHAFRIIKPEGENWRLATEATVSIELEADDPMRSEDDLYWYWYSAEQGYWHRAGPVTVNGDAASGLISVFAWWAIGSPSVPDLACAKGRVEDDLGEPLARAEVLVSADGLFGTRRAYTDFHGEFCVPVNPGASISAQVMGTSAETGYRYIGSTSFTADPTTSTCDGVCGDVGVIATTVVAP